MGSIRERAQARVREYLAQTTSDQIARFEAVVRSEQVPVASLATAVHKSEPGVLIWRINREQDEQHHAGHVQSHDALAPQHDLLPWTIFSTAMQGTLHCDMGDLIVLHASGRGACGIYAVYIATHAATRCELYSDQVQNFRPAFRHMRMCCQWRVGARFLATLDVPPEECKRANIHGRVTPHRYETIANTPACASALQTALAAWLEDEVHATGAATLSMSEG